MGQAKLRGTKEQRVAAALALEQQRKAERKLREQLREQKKAERWRTLTPEQKAKELEAAQAEVAFLSMFSGLAKQGLLPRRR